MALMPEVTSTSTPSTSYSDHIRSTMIPQMVSIPGRGKVQLSSTAKALLSFLDFIRYDDNEDEDEDEDDDDEEEEKMISDEPDSECIANTRIISNSIDVDSVLFVAKHPKADISTYAPNIRKFAATVAVNYDGDGTLMVHICDQADFYHTIQPRKLKHGLDTLFGTDNHTFDDFYTFNENDGDFNVFFDGYIDNKQVAGTVTFKGNDVSVYSYNRRGSSRRDKIEPYDFNRHGSLSVYGFFIRIRKSVLEDIGVSIPSNLICASDELCNSNDCMYYMTLEILMLIFKSVFFSFGRD
jgi:hypothetical protein